MKRIPIALSLAAAWVSPAMAGVYSYPRLTIDTGLGGQAISIAATIATLTTQSVGPPTVDLSKVTLNLPDFTGLSAEMDWSSPCEFTMGCIISAPSEIDLTGFSGTLQFVGPNMALNGATLPWDGGLDTTHVSGPLVFTRQAGVYTDNLNVITLSVPEPGTWALLGVGLLGLGFAVRRRAV